MRDQPSQLFQQYVMRFPNSYVAQQYIKGGDEYIDVCGSFAQSLFNGDVWKALQCADRGNQQRLALILQKGWNYPVKLDVEGADRIYGDGEKQVDWMDIRGRMDT